jgi:transglutaminase-like putative cysteine protease
VTFLDAREQARFGVIPGRSAFQTLGRLARNGFSDIHNSPAPAPAHKGLVLLTVVGVAAVALIVDLLAVTLRRAALAGLPLLALFTISTATARSGINLLEFVAAATGYLLLLYVDNRERVARWGAAVGTGSKARPASAWSLDPSATPAPASLGRRVGAAAVGLGVVVPLLIPGLHSGIHHRHGGGGNGNGGGNVHTFDPFVFVGNSLHNRVNQGVFRYTTTSRDPGYLRLTSLDSYNNGAFAATELRAPESARVTNGLGVSQPSPTTVTTKVSFNNGFAFRWLPVPSTALKVTVSGDWRYDPQTATIFSASTTTSGSDYTVVSSPNRPTADELANDGSSVGHFQVDLLTPSVSPRVRELAQRLTRNAHSNFDAALEIQRFLTSKRFSYDASVGKDAGTDPLTDFLFHTRRGFCQQFASAMAVMARLTGIPSRVAVGFTAGTLQPDGSYLVTTHDAHAWPELWFPRYGWLPFEPTPRRDGQAQTPSYARFRPNAAGAKSGSAPKVTPSTPAGHAASGLPKKRVGAGEAAAGHRSGTRGGDLAALIAVIVAALLVVTMAVPGAVRWETRRRRWRALRADPAAVGAAWAELRDSAIDVGAPWNDAGTPRTLAAALTVWAGADGGIREPLEALRAAEEQDRYAPSRPAVTTDLRRDTEAVRAALVRGWNRRRRLLVVLLPRSTRELLRNRLARAADVVQRLDEAPGLLLARARRRLRVT